LVQVAIRPADRADFEVDRSLAAFSSYTAVVDLQPEAPRGAATDLGGGASCALCGFPEFLSGVERLEMYVGLGPLSAFFETLPEIGAAAARGDVEGLRVVASRLGAVGCVEHVLPGTPPVLPGLPRLVQAPAWPVAPASLLPGGPEPVCVLVPPGGQGIDALREQATLLRRAGVDRIAIGYVEHATAMDCFSGFCERPGAMAEWSLLPRIAQELSLRSLDLVMAIPPCAMLQWRANLPLDRMRAQLDRQFRKLDGVSSMMCAENVSGYCLINDLRPLLLRTPARQTRLAIRYENIILEFMP
jgi:hypothetical protein